MTVKKQVQKATKQIRKVTGFDLPKSKTLAKIYFGKGNANHVNGLSKMQMLPLIIQELGAQLISSVPNDDCSLGHGCNDSYTFAYKNKMFHLDGSCTAYSFPF